MTDTWRFLRCAAATFLVLLSLSGANACDGDGGAAPPADTSDTAAPSDAADDTAADDAADPGDADPGDAGGGDATAPGGLCDENPASVPPVGTDDATYDEVVDHECAAGPPTEGLCFCDAAMETFVRRLLACEPLGGGAFWGQGSVYARAVGRADGACLLEIGVETEGGVQVHDCALPLPIVPWPGLRTDGDVPLGSPSFLAGIEPYCTLVDSCCVIGGCPDPCPDDAPTCPFGGPNLSCDP